MENNELLSASELGDHLGVSGGTVRRWVKDGLLKPEFTTPGGHYKFNLTDALRQLNKKD